MPFDGNGEKRNISNINDDHIRLSIRIMRVLTCEKHSRRNATGKTALKVTKIHVCMKTMAALFGYFRCEAVFKVKKSYV